MEKGMSAYRSESFVTAHSFQKPSIICAYIADYLKTVIPEVVPLNLDPNTVKLVIFVPESHKELVKSSAFAAGAGEQDEYQQCCWETKGRGQFRPSSKSNPFCGSKNNLNHVIEYRIEMLCPISAAKRVEQAITDAHPYESVPFEFLPLYIR